jgi:zinc protease
MKRRLWGTFAVTVLFLSGILLAQPQVKFEQYTLDNGLTVILHEDHSAPLASIMMMYHVGSKNETKGRTGFAHLFEHVMFQGSEHVKKEEHFKLLQQVGANVNGSTSQDRTNYFETLPSNGLELAIYLESDRMGFLLPAISQEKLDNQRDVVKNERRQSYENVPYGLSYETIVKALFPETHPYSWPVIGSMADLSAASLADVKAFFATYYAPNNSCVVIAGDINPAQVKTWVQKYFGPIPRGKAFSRPQPQETTLAEDKRLVLEDRVQLPRLYLTWPSARGYTRTDAVRDVMTDILSSGKNSRLYKSLVYEKQIAQSVSASQDGSEIAGQMSITVTAKPGKNLTEIEVAVKQVIDDLLANGVTEKEVQTSMNQKEAQLVNRRATVFGKTSALATSYTLTGDTENINRELERFKGITPAEILADSRQAFAAHKVVLSIVPQGKTELAAQPPASK